MDYGLKTGLEFGIKAGSKDGRGARMKHHRTRDRGNADEMIRCWIKAGN